MDRKTIAVVAALGVPALLLVGIGVGLCVGPAGSAAVGAADPSRASLAGALSFMVHLTLGAVGVAGGTAMLYGLSAAKLQQELAALGVSLSAADRLTLTAAAPGAAATRHILARFDSAVADHITGVMRDAFVFGLNQSYWLCLALAVIGIFVAFSLDEEKLTAGPAKENDRRNCCNTDLKRITLRRCINV